MHRLTPLVKAIRGCNVLSQLHSLCELLRNVLSSILQYNVFFLFRPALCMLQKLLGIVTNIAFVEVTFPSAKLQRDALGFLGGYYLFQSLLESRNMRTLIVFDSVLAAIVSILTIKEICCPVRKIDRVFLGLEGRPDNII